VKELKQEANVKFLVNQANLRKSELQNNSVQEFVKLLKRINADKEGLNIRNVEVQAYASPEGGFAFNDRLANKRQDVSEDYVSKTLKETKVDSPIDAKYTAQDWEGFQKLVEASNIQDKDVILRVLSMYKDPEEREQQIRNMSAGFQELAFGILPELRRSRLIINYETIGRSDAQIKAQYQQDPGALSVEELLYAATLEENISAQEAIYKKTADIYPADYRALNNLAVLAFNQGDMNKAKSYIQDAFRVYNRAPEANANLALMALRDGDIQRATDYVAKAEGANALNEVLGNLEIAKGNYSQAEEYLKDSNNNSAALAYLLNNDLAQASVALKYAKNDAMTDYLQAILNARMGKNEEAAKWLNSAIKKDASLADYAEKDLEMINVRR
jgi:tetratricopeptide (TPR) repeat protein